MVSAGSAGSDAEKTFVLNASTTLAANTYYWIVPKKISNDPYAKGVVVGSGGYTDAYTDGYWSSGSARDIYFKLRMP